MELNNTVFQYKYIRLVLKKLCPASFIFNVYKGDMLLGEAKWDYREKSYGFFRIKGGELETDDEWDYIKYCMGKLTDKHYGR